ncbi:hypothetical protein KAJ87_02335 [Candidatus Pacearchaeota archaeon]|nr:hypothetical protein [Candidatus Pacearchaeota archaeon]
MKEYARELEDKVEEISIGDYVFLMAENGDKAAGFVRNLWDEKINLSHKPPKKSESYWKSYLLRIAKGDRNLPLNSFKDYKVIKLKEYIKILENRIVEFNVGDHLFLMGGNEEKAAGFVKKSKDGEVTLSYEPENKIAYANHYPPIFTLGDRKIQLNDFNKSKVVKAEDFWLIKDLIKSKEL